MPDIRRYPRLTRSLWAIVIYLAGATLLIGLVTYYFLIPAMRVAHDANVAQKHQLVAYSRLLLAVVLFILCVGLLLLFRVGRFFFPSAPSKRHRTQYIDVWAEAGRRTPAPPSPDEETPE